MDEDLRTALCDDVDRAAAHLGGALHGLSDRLREMWAGSGSGYEVNRRFRESNIYSGAPLAPLAEELAAEMAAIVAECAALDANREVITRLDGSDL